MKPKIVIVVAAVSNCGAAFKREYNTPGEADDMVIKLRQMGYSDITYRQEQKS